MVRSAGPIENTDAEVMTSFSLPLPLPIPLFLSFFLFLSPDCFSIFPTGADKPSTGISFLTRLVGTVGANVFWGGGHDKNLL